MPYRKMQDEFEKLGGSGKSVQRVVIRKVENEPRYAVEKSKVSLENTGYSTAPNACRKSTR